MKHYAAGVTLSTKGNLKFLQQIATWFKKSVNGNEHKNKVNSECFNIMIHASIKEMNMLLFWPL